MIFFQGKHGIIDCIIGYYSQVKLHRYSDSLPVNVAEEKYWNKYKSVVQKTRPLQLRYALLNMEGNHN